MNYAEMAKNNYSLAADGSKNRPNRYQQDTAMLASIAASLIDIADMLRDHLQTVHGDNS